LLEAELDEHREVVHGWTKHGDTRQNAPANAVGTGPVFDVCWRCTVCGRNTLRTFHAGSLRQV
jgi:hypothetical protein